MASVSSQCMADNTADKARLCNVVSILPQLANRVPDQTALVLTSGYDRAGKAIYRHLTCAELEAYTNRCANGLISAGIERGMRTLLMVKPGLEFIGITFALVKIGAVPVLIDPGMGIGRLLECVQHVAPEALIGIPKAHALRMFKRRPFSSVRRVVTVGRRWFWGGPTLQGACRNASSEFDIADTRADEVAAILFTSGSTGPAKGVVYEHGMFVSQVELIQSRFGIEPGEVDMPSFPLFSLFSAGMGMTCVIPDMDPSRPADASPAIIVQTVKDHGVTSGFGSPALWNAVSRYCVERGIVLPTIKRILISGAPVSPDLLERLHKMLGPEAEVFTPYGATESLPVASIGSREVLAECADMTRDGAGVCVGKPFDSIETRFIRVTDDPIEDWSDDLLVPDGEPGELVVSGPVVTKEYFGLEKANAASKIRKGNTIWHRIGDIGYRDAKGRLWFCGRKNHRVETAEGPMYTIPCEAIFNRHPDIFRSALVGVGPMGKQTPVIIVEPEVGKYPENPDALKAEMLELARGFHLTCAIKQVLLHRSLPVDVRHNAKINREKLALWAEEQLL